MTAIDFHSAFLQFGGTKEEPVATLNIKGIPESLHRRLKARAKKNHRSVAREVTEILNHALDEPDLLSIMELEGLGKDLWKGIDPAKYIDEERNSW